MSYAIFKVHSTSKTYFLSIWGKAKAVVNDVKGDTYSTYKNILSIVAETKSNRATHTNTIVKEFGTWAKTSHEIFSYTLLSATLPTIETWCWDTSYATLSYYLLPMRKKMNLIKDFEQQSTCTLRPFETIKDHLSRGDREGCLKSRKFLFTCHSLFCQTRWGGEGGKWDLHQMWNT